MRSSIGGGGSDTAHARSIPWDCSDWQAAAAVDDAANARVSVILESLATNRGKTLYCAVDQSDTFTKAETWAAGRDRNERDDTVYYGENGRFRGFLAAQEGYLTDGESGVTGISRDRVFEFPEEQRRRVKRTKRLRLAGLIAGSPWSQRTSSSHPQQADAEMNARSRVNGNSNDPGSDICGPSGDADLYSHSVGPDRCRDSDFVRWAQEAAQAECNARGYKKAVNTADDYTTETWDYSENLYEGNLNNHNYQARRTRTYETTCVKTVRRRR